MWGEIAPPSGGAEEDCCRVHPDHPKISGTQYEFLYHLPSASSRSKELVGKSWHQLQHSIRDGSHDVLPEVEVLVPDHPEGGEEGGDGVRQRRSRDSRKDRLSPAGLQEVLHVEPGRHYPGFGYIRPFT